MADAQSGRDIKYYVVSLNDIGQPIDTTEEFIQGIVSVSPTTRTNQTLNDAPLEEGDGPAREDSTVDTLGVKAFSITMRPRAGDKSFNRLVVAEDKGRNIAIRRKKIVAGVELSNITVRCSIVGFDKTESQGSLVEAVFRFEEKRVDGPRVPAGVTFNPIVLSASDTYTLNVDTELFSGATSYAVGTLDPASNASASAVLAPTTNILTITADASRTGDTKIPITGTDGQSRSFTYTLVVRVG